MLEIERSWHGVAAQIFSSMRNPAIQLVPACAGRSKFTFSAPFHIFER